MKRKNIITRMLVLFFAGAFILSSCNEDKGNYDYTDIDGIDLEGFDSYGYTGIKMAASYLVEPGETLVIKPEVTFIEGTDTYEYEWYAYPVFLNNANSDQVVPVLIGEEKDLEFPMEGDWAKPTATAQDLTFLLKVINPKTGIKYWRKTMVGVNLYSKTGFLALTKKANDEFDFDVVALNSGVYGVYTDVLAGLGVDIDRKANPRDLATMWDFNSEGKYGVFLLTDDYSIRLNSSDYGYDPDRDLSKQIEPWATALKSKPFIGTKLVARCYGTNGLNTRFHFFHQDGNCYFSNTSAMSYYDEPLNRDKSTLEKYNVAPYVATMYRRTTIGQNTSAMLFNKDLPGFMVHEGISGASHTTRPLEAANAGQGYQDANYFMMFKDTDKPNDELVYMHDDFAILKSSQSNEYRIVIFTLIPSGINLDGTAAAVANNNSNVFRAYLPDKVQNVTNWVFKNDTNGGMLFCTTADNKLWALNLKNLTRCWSRSNDNFTGNEIGGAEGATWQWTDARCKDITDKFIKAPYTKITCLKKVSDTAKNYNNDLQVMLEEDGTIVLATCDPNGEVGKNGQLQFFTYDSVQETLVAKEMKTEDGSSTNAFTGMGEVITVVYKL